MTCDDNFVSSTSSNWLLKLVCKKTELTIVLEILLGGELVKH